MDGALSPYLTSQIAFRSMGVKGVDWFIWLSKGEN